MDTIFKAILKQYAIMLILYSHFLCQKAPVRLSCCKPVAILPELRTLITRECEGVLLNKYLKTRIPFLFVDKIRKHFFNIGFWLKGYHDCFADQRIQKTLTQRFPDLKDPENFPNHLLDNRSLTLCHNDFSPRNIFVSQNSVEGIDFVGARFGCPQEDIDFFSRYILSAKFNGLYTPSIKQLMLKSFHQGYSGS